MNQPKQANKAAIISKLKKLESKSKDFIEPSDLLNEHLKAIWDLSSMTEKEVMLVVDSITRSKHKYIVVMDLWVNDDQSTTTELCSKGIG